MVLRQRPCVLSVLQNVPPIIAPAVGGNDLLVFRIAHDDDALLLRMGFVNDVMNFCHKNTGGVHQGNPLLLRCAIERFRLSVRADDHHIPLRGFLDVLNHSHALLFQGAGYRPIVNQRSAGVQGTLLPLFIFLNLFHGQIDGSLHAKTEARPIRADDFHFRFPPTSIID